MTTMTWLCARSRDEATQLHKDMESEGYKCTCIQVRAGEGRAGRSARSFVRPGQVHGTGAGR